MSRPILVATDGSEQSSGALRAARKLEMRKGWKVRAVAVVEPIPVFDTGFGASLPEARIRDERRRALRERAAGQIEDLGVDPGAWELEVMEGPAARRIVEAAASLDARAILVGIGRHGAVERLLGAETVLKLARLAHRPVLALPGDADDVPRRAVVAVDFSSFSLRAARTALEYVKPPGRIHLLHVMAGLDALPDAGSDWRRAYREQVESRLRALRRELRVPDDEWTVSTTVRTGHPGDEICAFAEEVGAGLIVAGSHGHSFLGRLILGSVSTALVRGTPGGALILPPREPAPEVGAGEEGERKGRARQWSALMEDFSARNEGRPVCLELDDPELGAQTTGKGFHLRGVTYESHSERIVVYLGRPGETRSHLTHGIAGARELEVTSGRDPDVEALRIGLERGQLLLRVLAEG